VEVEVDRMPRNSVSHPLLNPCEEEKPRGRERKLKHEMKAQKQRKAMKRKFVVWPI